jgi:hypothetical protein
MIVKKKNCDVLFFFLKKKKSYDFFERSKFVLFKLITVCSTDSYLSNFMANETWDPNPDPFFFSNKKTR